MTESLVEKVAELKKLEEQAQLYRFNEEYNVYDIGEKRHVEAARKELLLAVPTMLAILGEIRAGDADEIAYAIDVVAQYQNDDATIEVLRRYQAMAACVEARE